jgi:hypothetical protein
MTYRSVFATISEKLNEHINFGQGWEMHKAKKSLWLNHSFHWQVFSAKMSAIFYHDYTTPTCLGHLVWYDTNTNSLCRITQGSQGK